jgi:hypothetical protein
MFNIMKKRADGLRKAKGERPSPPPPPPEKESAPPEKSALPATLEPEGIVSPKEPDGRFGGMRHRASQKHHQKLADHFRSKAGGPPKPKGPPPPPAHGDFDEEY